MGHHHINLLVSAKTAEQTTQGDFKSHTLRPASPPENLSLNINLLPFPHASTQTLLFVLDVDVDVPSMTPPEHGVPIWQRCLSSIYLYHLKGVPRLTSDLCEKKA